MFCTISRCLPQLKILSLCKDNLEMFPIASWGLTLIYVPIFSQNVQISVTFIFLYIPLLIHWCVKTGGNSLCVSCMNEDIVIHPSYHDYSCYMYKVVFLNSLYTLHFKTCFLKNIFNDHFTSVSP